MKCPLFFRPKADRQEALSRGFDDCLKGECAWWLADIGMCSIRELALETRYTQCHLQDIIKELTLVRPK